MHLLDSVGAIWKFIEEVPEVLSSYMRGYEFGE